MKYIAVGLCLVGALMTGCERTFDTEREDSAATVVLRLNAAQARTGIKLGSVDMLVLELGAMRADGEWVVLDSSIFGPPQAVHPMGNGKTEFHWKVPTALFATQHISLGFRTFATKTIVHAVNYVFTDGANEAGEVVITEADAEQTVIVLQSQQLVASLTPLAVPGKWDYESRDQRLGQPAQPRNTANKVEFRWGSGRPLPPGSYALTFAYRSASGQMLERKTIKVSVVRVQSF